MSTSSATPTPGGPKTNKPTKTTPGASPSAARVSESESGHGLSLTLGNLKSSGDLAGLWAKVTNDSGRVRGPFMLNVRAPENFELYSAKPGVATPKAEIACLPQERSQLLRCLISGLKPGATETFDIRLEGPVGSLLVTADIARLQHPGALVRTQLTLPAVSQQKP